MAKTAMSGTSFVAILILILLVSAIFGFYLISPVVRTEFASSLSARTSSTSTFAPGGESSVSTSQPSASVTSTTSTKNLPDPSIRNGSATITYPPDYDKLANYTLSLINKDRAAAGLSPVSLSPEASGQQHADSMLYFQYFSHWDTQGYKPYMRYTLLGGAGGMEENVAYEYYPSHFLNSNAVEKALAGLEDQMMNNDSACCQNGHRDNILQSLHNRVSIGIAYDNSYVYLVQDFENFYLNLSQPVLSGSTIRLLGPSGAQLGQVVVYVFYDKYPQPLNSTQLGMPPYQGSYNEGRFIGGVVPPCSFSCLSYPGNITVHAQTWRVSSTNVDIVFPVTEFTQQYGKGVYTIVLAERAAKPIILFNLSMFVAG